MHPPPTIVATPSGHLFRLTAPAHPRPALLNAMQVRLQDGAYVDCARRPVPIRRAGCCPVSA